MSKFTETHYTPPNLSGCSERLVQHIRYLCLPPFWHIHSYQVLVLLKYNRSSEWVTPAAHWSAGSSAAKARAAGHVACRRVMAQCHFNAPLTPIWQERLDSTHSGGAPCNPARFQHSFIFVSTRWHLSLIRWLAAPEYTVKKASLRRKQRDCKHQKDH